MTRLRATEIPVPAWVGGMVPEAEPGAAPPGTLESGTDLVPLPGGKLAVRGGSRILNTLLDGGSVELSHVCYIGPFTPTGVVAIGWSDSLNKHYLYRLDTALQFFTGSQATSRHDLTASPSTTWAQTTTPARPNFAELYEKLFLADATTQYSARNELLSVDGSGALVRPTFAFDGGAAKPIKAYCVEEFNNHLFVAGYGDETIEDRPEMVRHSFLGRSPDSTAGGAEGFDPEAWIMLGAKGQRVTALRKGRGLLLACKENELYRITGFGQALAGWQFTVEAVENTTGMGCANPFAVIYAEEFFYGIGAAGPWRSDGYRIEDIGAARRRDWNLVDKLVNAWVGWHPYRRLVLFAFHPAQAAAGRSATYPWTIWAWDIDRQVWQPDWKPQVDLFFGAVIPTAASAGPAGAPSNQNYENISTTGFRNTWTNGDASASTEIWRAPSGGAFALVGTVGPGVVGFDHSGLSDHAEYLTKVRHKKGGAYSEFSVTNAVKTLIAPPTMFGGSGVDPIPRIFLSLRQNSQSTTLVIERSPAGLATWTEIADFFAPVGDVTYFDETIADCSTDFEYRARSRDTGWTPAESVYSATTVPIDPCVV